MHNLAATYITWFVQGAPHKVNDITAAMNNLPSMTIARAPDVPQSMPSDSVEAGSARERGGVSTALLA